MGGLAYNIPVLLDVIHNADARDMSHLDDESVQLIITSPPYNVGKDYEDHSDSMNLDEYLDMLAKVWDECHRVLWDGGRIAVNVANTWRKPYLPLHAFIISQLLDRGFLMRGEVIWDKGVSRVSTAWGSWMSPSNPTLRDVHEYIMIFSKGSWRTRPRVPGTAGDISSKEFLEWTKSIWSFPGQSAKAVGHPAPFPVELPTRLIKLYSYPGDIILDPFMGSGTTAVAAAALGRHFVGYEISEEYCKIAEQRVGSVKRGLF